MAMDQYSENLIGTVAGPGTYKVQYSDNLTGTIAGTYFIFSQKCRVLFACLGFANLITKKVSFMMFTVFSWIYHINMAFYV